MYFWIYIFLQIQICSVFLIIYYFFSCFNKKAKKRGGPWIYKFCLSDGWSHLHHNRLRTLTKLFHRNKNFFTEEKYLTDGENLRLRNHFSTKNRFYKLEERFFQKNLKQWHFYVKRKILSKENFKKQLLFSSSINKKNYL